MDVLIYSPSIHLVSGTSIDELEALKYIQECSQVSTYQEAIKSASTDDAVVELAARSCYLSYGKGRTNPQQFFDNILDSKHGSTLEHLVYTFSIGGVSRSLTHELIRHRAGFSYSEESQRFVDMSNAKFIVPVPFIGNEELENIFLQSCFKSLETYSELVRKTQISKEELSSTDKRKIIRQSARAVLPSATETHIVVTGNLRAWRNFMEQRGTIHADLEIRRLAVEIFKVLKTHVTFLLNDVTIEKAPFVPALKFKNSKV